MGVKMSRVNLWFHDKRRVKGELVPFIARIDYGRSLNDRIFVLTRMDGKGNAISYESWQAARKDGWTNTKMSRLELKENGKKAKDSKKK